MKLELFFLLLLVVLVVALFFVLRKLMQDEASKIQKQRDGSGAVSDYLANQALGSFVCAAIILSFLICSLLIWWQIVSAVAVAAVVIGVKLRYFQKK